jgi:uncharacterized HAD superfamily protein
MKNIVVDVDGVILDFSTPFINWYNEKFNKEIKTKQFPLLNHNPDKYNFDHNETYPDDFFVYLQEFIDTKPDLNLIEENMPKFFQKLNETYNIHILSNYPHLDARCENLKKFNIPYKTIQCDVVDKLTIIKELNAEFVIEDHPVLIHKLSDNNIKCYVPILNYTKHFDLPHITLYNNINELESILFKDIH